MTEPEVVRPTKEEIAELPRWAQVAFAARCARRVQPYVSELWHNAPAKHLEAIARATLLAEKKAADPNDVRRAELGAAKRDMNDAEASAVTVPDAPAGDLVHAVFSALYAATLADGVAENMMATNVGENLTLNVAETVAHAVSADSTVSMIRRDFELLRELAKKEGWTDETPVPPDVFGPMWPDGVPEGWPEEDSYDKSEQAIELRIALPPMPDSPEARRALSKVIGEVLLKANALDLGVGGSGLRIASASVHSIAGTRQEVGS